MNLEQFKPYKRTIIVDANVFSFENPEETKSLLSFINQATSNSDGFGIRNNDSDNIELMLYEVGILSDSPEEFKTKLQLLETTHGIKISDNVKVFSREKLEQKANQEPNGVRFDVFIGADIEVLDENILGADIHLRPNLTTEINVAHSDQPEQIDLSGKDGFQTFHNNYEDVKETQFMNSWLKSGEIAVQMQEETMGRLLASKGLDLDTAWEKVSQSSAVVGILSDRAILEGNFRSTLEASLYRALAPKDPNGENSVIQEERRLKNFFDTCSRMNPHLQNIDEARLNEAISDIHNTVSHMVSEAG